MRKKVKVAFPGMDYFFRPIQDPKEFFLKMDYLYDKFDFELSSNPDVIFSRTPVREGPYKRVYYSCENVSPPQSGFDWYFGVDYEGKVTIPNYMRQPNYVKLGAGSNLVGTKKTLDVEKVLESKTKFCAFAYSHNVPQRNSFFDYISKYKRVDSPGSCRNNCPPIGTYPSADKSRYAKSFNEDIVEFLRPYKFFIAFENSSHPGYTTEKIYNPMLANTIPIYIGNSYIRIDFNEKSFVNPYNRNLQPTEFFDYLLSEVMRLDKDVDAYAKMLLEPWYPNDKMPRWVDPEIILERFSEIFN